MADLPVNDKKIIKGEVTIKKKSTFDKMLGTFFSCDWAELKHYIIFDQAIPKFKDYAYEILVNGLAMAIYKNDTSARPKSNKNGGTFSYNLVTPNNNNSASRSRVVKSSLDYDEDDVTLTERADAARVLETMRADIADYNSVTVGRMYKCLGMDPDFVAYQWGWKNLDSADVIRVRGGWRLKLPKPIHLD